MHPFLGLFHGPDTNTTTDTRPVSTVPQQALYLMNSPETQKLAAALAGRLLTAANDDVARLQLAHVICYARPATAAEVERSRKYLQEYRRQGQAEAAAWTSYARILLSANEFVYVD